MPLTTRNHVRNPHHLSSPLLRNGSLPLPHCVAERTYEKRTLADGPQTFSRPHHSEMNRAVDWVILRIDSRFTLSSKPWTSSDCGP